MSLPRPKSIASRGHSNATNNSTNSHPSTTTSTTSRSFSSTTSRTRSHIINSSQQQHQHQRFLPVPSGLLSSALPPSLLENDTTTATARMENGNDTATTTPTTPDDMRPRRLWTIQDKWVPHWPKHYPPMNETTSAVISDHPMTAPSVVAIRISECLRKCSLSVEYDDEQCTATCMTPNRCHFVIHLWNYSKLLMVEVVRISGCTMTFHHYCRRILQAAQAISTGQDDRPWQATHGMEFTRLSKKPRTSDNKTSSTITLPSPPSLPNDTSSSDHEEAMQLLESCQELLLKDRLEPQLLGMERLVYWTDLYTCRAEISLEISKEILSQDFLLDYILTSKKSKRTKTGSQDELKRDPTPALSSSQQPTNRNSRNALRLLRNRMSNKRHQELDVNEEVGAHPVVISPSNSQEQEPSFSSSSDAVMISSLMRTEEESRHEALLRAMGLRVFRNALVQCANTGAVSTTTAGSGEDVEDTGPVLRQILSTVSSWTSPMVLQTLMEDWQGGVQNRPPSVVMSHTLASIHETAVAMECLRLLRQHGPPGAVAMYLDQQQQDQNKPSTTSLDHQNNLQPVVLERLEAARVTGRATHLVLQQQSEITYSEWTQPFRSC